MDSKRNYSAKQLKPKIAAAFLAYLCCLGLVFFDVPAVSAGLFSDGVAEMGEAGKTVAQAAKKNFFGAASIFGGIKCFFGFDCPPKPAASRVVIGSAAGRITGGPAANQAGPKPGQAGESDESPESRAILTADPAAMPPATGVYANLPTPAPEPTPEPEPGILSGVSQFFEMTFEPAQSPAQDIVACTNTVIVDEETKRKVDIILRQLNSDTPHFGLGQLVKKPANLDMDSLKISSGAFSVDKHGNIATEGDLEVTGNFTVSGAQTYSGAVTLNASTSIPLFKIEQTGSGVALEADNITLKGSAIGTNDTDTDLLINPNGTGAVQFHTASNYIDPAGSLVLNGDITLTSGGTFYTTDNGDLVFAPNGTGNLVVGENGNPASIIPFKDSTTGYDLGAATSRWYDIYAKGKLDIDSTTLTPTQLSFADTGKITTGASKDLTLQPGTNGKTRITDGTDYVDIADGTQALYAIKGANVVKLADGTYAIDAAGDVRITGNLNVSGGILFTSSAGEQIDTTADHLLKLTTTGDAQVVLGDNAGSNQFQIKDSGGSTVAGIDSDGKATLADVAVTGELGIGTTNPEEALDVNGRIKLAQTAAPATTSDKLYNVSGNLYWNGAVLALGSSVSGTVGYLPKFTASNALGNSILYEDAGKIGVGTASPLALLHVAGKGAFGDSVTTASAARALNLIGTDAVMRVLRVSAVNAPSVELVSRTSADGANVAYWDFYAEPSDASFRIRDRLNSDNNRLVIDGAGNVGIGTTGPVELLDVNGRLRLAQTTAPAITTDKLYNVSGNLLWNGVNLTAAGALPVGTEGQTLYSNAGVWTANNGLFYDDTNGRVGIGTTAPEARLTVGSGALSNSVDAQILIARDVDDTFTGNGHAFSDSSDITRSGSIGYNSFDARINIEGTANYDHYAGFQYAPVYSSSGTINIIDALASAPQVTAGIVNNVYGAYILNPTGAGSVINNYGIYVADLTKGSTGNWAFYGDGTTKSRFGGAVGIGADPSTQMLYVKRTSAGSGGPNTNYDEIVVENNDNTGISIFSPDDKYGALQFANPSKTQAAMINWKYSDNLMQVGTVNTGAQLAFLVGNGAEKVRVDSSGNVGIGTTTPTARLQVAGGNVLIDNSKAFQAKETDGTARNIFYFDSSNDTEIWTGSGGLTRFFNSTGTNEFVRLAVIGNSWINAGNVGIGTTAPGYALDVNGVINTSNYYRISGAMALNRETSSILTLGGSTSWTTINYGNASTTTHLFGAGNVGIGTTTPGGKLEVSSTGMDHIKISRSGQTSRFIGIGSGDQFYLGNWDDQAKGLTILSSGNVGIGTTNPTTKFEVAGNINLTVDGSAAIPAFRINDSDTGIYHPASNNLGFSTGGIERVRIDSSGNVGIGTTVPGAKLEIYNDIAAGQTLSSIIGSSNNSGGGQILIGQNIVLSGLQTSSIYGQKISITSEDATGVSTAYGTYIQPVATGNFGTWYGFYVAAKSGIGTITNQYALVTEASAGNVGIGTTAPATLLDVNGITSLRGYVNHYQGTTFSAQYGGGIAVFVGGASNDFGILANKKLLLGSNNDQTAPRMTIDTSGNVGIGTTTPGTKLHVQIDDSGALAANLKLENINGMYKPAGIDFWSTGGVNGTSYNSGRIEGKFLAGTGYPDAAIILKTPTGNGTWNDTLTVRNGNVGIGTTAPSAGLDIQKAMTAASGVARGMNVAQVLTAGADNDVLTGLRIAPTFTNGAYSGVKNYGLIVESGNVGIGTTAPAYKLDVAGMGRFSSGIIAGDAVVAGTSGLYYGTNGTGNYAFGAATAALARPLLLSSGNATYNDGYISFSAAGNEVVRINSSGNVGIGTTAPDAALDVYAATGAEFSIFDGYYRYNFGESAKAIGGPNSNYFSLYKDGSVVHYNTSGGIAGHSFDIASAEKMRIDSAGNVGIGTTAPGALLEVKSIAANSTEGQEVLRLNSKINWSTVGSGPKLMFYSYSVENPLAAIKSYVIETAKTGLAFDTGYGALSTKMVINNEGNVGIGTTGPSDKLEVNGSLRVLGGNALKIESATANKTIGFQATADGSYGNLTELTIRSQVTDTGSSFAVRPNGTGGISSSMTLYKTDSGSTNYGYLQLLAANGASGSLYHKIVSRGVGTVGTSPIAFGFEDYAGGAGAFAEAMRISTSGNVGIGTTAPGEKLEVNTGNIKIFAGYFTSQRSAGNEWFIGKDVSSANRFRIKQDVNSPYPVLMQASADGSTWNNGLAFDLTSGNVGIGTTTPTTGKLAVVGPDDTTGLILDLKNNSGTSKFTINDYGAVTSVYMNASGGGVSIPSAAGSLTINSTNNSGAVFTVNGVGTAYAATFSGGNVGIGTTTPGYPLDVESASFSGGIISLFKTSGNSDTAFQVQNSVAAWQFSVRESGDSNPGGFNFYYSPDGSTGWVNAMNLSTGGNVSLPSGALTVSGAGDNSFAGNVGIGTTSPGYGLDVETGSLKVNNGITGVGSSGTIYLGDSSFTKTYGAGWSFLGGFSAATNNLASFGAVSITPPGPYTSGLTVNTWAVTGSPTNAYGLQVNAPTGATNNYAAIFSSGNVGIGTTAPVDKLEVNGALRVTGATVGGAGSWGIMDYNSGAVRFISNGLDASTRSSYQWTIRESDNGGELTPLVISSAGNVGIGTTSPGTALDVVGIIRASNYVYSTGNIYSEVGKYMFGASDTGDRIYKSGSDARFNFGGDDRLTILSSGNVGIGTTSPGTLLQISKTHTGQTSLLTLNNIGTLTGDTADIDFSVSGSNAITGRISNIRTNRAVSGDSDLAFSVFSNGAQVERMRILDSGNVGIGTTGPAYKLDVNGTGRVNQLQIDSNSGIVFGDGTSNFTRMYRPSSSLDLRIGTPAGSDFVTVQQSSGNVGIGTTGPLSKLHSKEFGAKTAVNYAGYLENIATNTTTDNISKYGLYITSTGDFTGSSGTATNNYGLYIDTTSGGDNNYGLVVKTIPTTATVANVYYDSASGIFYYNASTERYKTNIAPLAYDYRKVLSLEPKQWNMINDGTLGIGVVAEDLEKLGLNELVVYNSAGQPDGIQWNRITTYMLGVMKDQQKEINALNLSLNATGTIGNASSTPELASGGEIGDWLANGLDSLGMGLQNGIASLKELVVGKVTTKEMCVTGSDGETVCVSKDELKRMLQNSGTSAGSSNDSGGSGGSKTSSSGSGSGGSAGGRTATSTPEQ